MGYKLNAFTGELDIAGGDDPTFDSLSPTTTKGDLIVHDATTNVRLPVGIDGQVLTADSSDSNGVAWAAAGGGLESQKNTPEFFDDFFFQGNASFGISQLNWIVNVSGGSSTFLQGISGHPGVCRLSSGTGGTNRSELLIATSNVPVLLGDGVYTEEWVIRVPTLSDGTDSFRVGIGFNGAIGGTHNNGCIFSYNHGVNSGNWTIECDDAAGTTTADTGTAVVAGTWYRLGIIVNAAATSVSFYINGVETTGSPLTTNIPDGAAEFTQPSSFIKNLAGTAADRYLDIDYFYMKIDLTSARA